MYTVGHRYDIRGRNDQADVLLVPHLSLPQDDGWPQDTLDIIHFIYISYP